MFRYNDNINERYTLGDSHNTINMYKLHRARNIPFDDGISLTDDMYCAFDSLKTFKALVIDEELKWLLNNHAFKVLMLDVTELIKGEHQVCYKKEHVIQTKDISSLFKSIINNKKNNNKSNEIIKINNYRISQL